MAKIAKTHEDIEAQIREIQGKKAALDEAQGVGLDSTGYHDQEIYGGSDSRFAGYVTSIAATELEDDDDDYSSSTSLLDTPGHGSGWAETPRTDRGGDSIGETPTPGASKRKSRWDETPASQMGGSTPVLTPGKTPIGTPAMNMATPTPGHIMSMTPEQLQAWRWEREIDERNRPLSDEELDAMFPEGYKVLPPPAGYVPIRTPARKLTATPTPLGGMTGFHMQTEDRTMKSVNDQPSGNLPFLKPDDIQYFDKLLVDVDESTLSPEEQKERKIMKLLLKIKNGTPPMRKAALRQITDKAREFGAGPLFNQILPLLMSPTLEDQERHLLVKVIDRILYKLDDLVRPYVHLVDTTVELANKVGAAEIISRIVDDLKDEAEQYRKMVMETIEKIMGNVGAADIDHKLEEQLIDGILYAFQEQTTEDSVMLNGFGTVVNALGKRVKPYLPQICGTVLWRLNNKSAKVRQQAADLISRTAVVMKTCQEEKLMGHLGVVLYEYLGEEYPEVLGSILGALKAIVNVIVPNE
ncbi:splicing factor 3B subunit 1-like [Otolemur garnettii]|uniref:splicing factor 3B subunit 1-like n=1 Tax=Otolemur garnettii TaxID=30611 RepID=UPI0006445DE8|nr:splicing factor 3B subunit 1-like [Otolemur garnettii]